MDKPLRVLIIEDSASDAELLTRHLTQAGFEIIWEQVEDAEAMNDALGRQSWDLILSGHSMPQFDSMHALQLMQDHGLDLPFIIVSGLIGETAAVAAMKAGAHDYIMKNDLSRLAPAAERELREACLRQERRRIEESHQLLAAAIDQAAETIVITDAQGCILFANPAFEKITGYTCKEVIGSNPRMLKSGKQTAEFYRHMWATLIRGEVWNGHFINKRKDGALYEEDASITPICDAGGRIINFVCVKRDVTHEIQLEAQLRQAQKMEIIGRLARGVAHEFNNLLTPILGYSSILLNKLPIENKHRTYVEGIQLAVNRAAALTQQLLAFSQKHTLQPRILDLNNTIAELYRMLALLLGENINLETELNAKLDFVLAEPGQIEQIFFSLAINARDTMPNGGRLLIRTSNIMMEAPATGEIQEIRPGKYVMLTVSKANHKMQDEDANEPLLHDKHQSESPGVGLSAIRNLVEQCNGRLSFQSNSDWDATINIYLPCSENSILQESLA